ncbi:MAG TPA: type I CRISPR-associated protein Cas7 [Patescibacteria group bacterium]|nr:type I CRISPR-associated protein Cas7 [Patescibacteria group bacterium]
MTEQINRGTGLLLIDVTNSNANGDPDRENDPRTRQDGRGEISPVSFKRKLRDLVAAKSAPIWKELAAEFSLGIDSYDVFEQNTVKFQDLTKMKTEDFLSRYWDARVFGSTVLEKEDDDSNNKHIASGVVQFGLGVSVDPVKIERLSTTKVINEGENKSKKMGPLAFRVVSYGLYVMPFFINATAAQKTHCSKKDIELLLKLIPHAYPETASYVRPQVYVRHAFYVEHNRARGTFSDFKMIEALTPRRSSGAAGAATSWKDYDEKLLVENIAGLKDMLKDKALRVVDLMDQM